MFREKLSCNLGMLKTTPPPSALSDSHFYITLTKTIKSWLKSEEDLVLVSAGFARSLRFSGKALVALEPGQHPVVILQCERTGLRPLKNLLAVLQQACQKLRSFLFCSGGAFLLFLHLYTLARSDFRPSA